MAETAKAKAVRELEKAKITLNDLTTRLKIANESKLSALEAIETVKKQTKKLEVTKSQRYLGNAGQELEEARDHYMKIATQLAIAKQELTKFRQDFDSVAETKSASLQQAAEAKRSMNINIERINELSKQLKDMQESAQQLRAASLQGQGQAAKMVAEKEAHIQACKTSKQEVEKKIVLLRKECNETENLKAKLAERTEEIQILQDEMRKVHALEMDKVKLVTAELNEATKRLQEVAMEENLLRNSVTSIKMELEDVKRERTEFEEKVLDKLSSEAENARKDVEMIRSDIIKLREEREKAILKVEESKEKLDILLEELEEAKIAEKTVHEEMKNLSNEKDKASDNNNMINISLEELESLKRKMAECESIAEAKEAEVRTKIEIINETRIIVEKRLEENSKSIEELKEATEIALRSAEMAESAQSVVEGELRRWRQGA
ncbi:hypothetical protein JCGZ_08949 [Jatropha curcas]|uniref:WEB family protein n=2 Tax=Jatropha curcas TaxID=180498 RepID=A0A067KGZ4_JATCU|nr:hypothetical protein JCGZ_08949 [Jatropha curcas]